jgi:Crp-like helix-turn-helix protein
VFGRRGVSSFSGALAGSLVRHVYTQVSNGSLQFMTAATLRHAMDENESLKDLVERYSRCFLQNIMQSAACNRLHTLEQRAARWLLTAYDKLQRSRFEVTQEFLASALGVKRSGFAVAARVLEKKRLVEWETDRVSILDRGALLSMSCGCYSRMSEEIVKLALHGTSGGGSHGKIVRLVPDVVCDLCRSSVDLPHRDSHDCISAIDGQLKNLHMRQRELVMKRHSLVEQRMAVLRELIRESKLRLRGGGKIVKKLKY